MAFTAAGVQSGVDTDLSGIDGVVTDNTTISLTGDANVDFYKQDSGTLTITGDLTVDSWHEKILGNTGAGNPLINVTTGSLTVTGSGELIVDTKEGANFTPEQSSIEVEIGGSVDLSDCIVTSARNCAFKNNGSNPCRINGTTFRKITTDAVQVVRFDFTTSTPDAIVNCTLDGIGGLLTGVGEFTGINLKNGGSVDSNNTLDASTSQSEYGIGRKNLLLSNIQFAGNLGEYSLKLRNDNTMTIRNFDLPLDQIGITGRLGLGGADQGAVFFERNLSFKITDGAGNVEGAVVKITDNREAGDTFTTPVTYTFTSGADGTTNQEYLLLGLVDALTATTQPEYEAYESYGDDDDMDVRMTANIASYNHNLATTPVGLVGLNDLEFSPAPLAIDSLITELDKAITDAYTALETPQKFYDRAKAYLVDNYAGEQVTIVTRSGDTITTTYDVVLASGGSNAFEFDGTTITVRCGTSFAGNITTTGTVSFSGSASVAGIISDSNGTTGILELV